MQAYLSKEFYESVKSDMKKYNSSYKNMAERTKILEQSAQKQMADAEKSYKILEEFGAIM